MFARSFVTKESDVREWRKNKTEGLVELCTTQYNFTVIYTPCWCTSSHDNIWLWPIHIWINRNDAFNEFWYECAFKVWLWLVYVECGVTVYILLGSISALFNAYLPCMILLSIFWTLHVRMIEKIVIFYVVFYCVG